ncbi:MAG: hypothetical protein KBT09_10650, partial [Bacteroidales bacterium]|nr:hypothetical protein [Candidatus Sodaliphilus fimicaballi]
MKRYLTLMIAVLACAAMANAAIKLKGDVNHDNDVDIADVNATINMILGTAERSDAGDLNGDGVIDIADLNAIINLILTGEREYVRTNADWVW